jgi:hypothetical protein
MRRRRAAKRQRLVAFALRRSLFRLLLIVGSTSQCIRPFPNALVASAEPLQRVRKSSLYQRNAAGSVEDGASDGRKEIAGQLTETTQNVTLETGNETHLSTYWLEEGENENSIYDSPSDEMIGEESSTNDTAQSSTDSGDKTILQASDNTVTEQEPELDGNGTLQYTSAREEATQNEATNDTANVTESERDNASDVAGDSASSSVEVIAPPWQEPDPMVMDPYWLSQPEEGQIMKPLWDAASEEGSASDATHTVVEPLQTGEGTGELVYNTYRPSVAYGSTVEGSNPNTGSDNSAGDINGNDASSGYPYGDQLIQPPWTGDTEASQILSPQWLVQDESQSQPLTDPVWMTEGGDSAEAHQPSYSSPSDSSGTGSSYETSTDNQGNQGPDVMTPSWVPQETTPPLDVADQVSANDEYVGINQPFYDPSGESSGSEVQNIESTDGAGSDQAVLPPWTESGANDTTGSETQSIIDPVWSEGVAQEQSGEPYHFTGEPPIDFQDVPRQPSNPTGGAYEENGGTDEDRVGGSTDSSRTSGSYQASGVTYGQLPNLPSWLDSMSFPPAGGKGSKGKGCSDNYQPYSSKASNVKKKGKCSESQRE